MAATTTVISVVHGCAFESEKVLSKGDARRIAGKLNDALDAVADIAFDGVAMNVSRDDQTPGS